MNMLMVSAGRVAIWLEHDQLWLRQHSIVIPAQAGTQLPKASNATKLVSRLRGNDGILDDLF